VRRLVSAVGTLSLLVVGSLGVGGVPAAKLESQVDAVAAEALAKSPGGLTIAVAREGKLVLARGYGEADVARHVAASGETIYPICSISKNFAAAAVLKLVEQGKVDLDAPAARYFASDPIPGRAVTVRQLLNHTSGAGSYNDGPAWDRTKGRPVPRGEMLALIRAADHGEPGRAWGYSNSAFYLAGLLVENVSGRDYWTFLAESFLRPLGMKRSKACVAVSDRARGYMRAGGGLQDAETESWANPFAGGGLCASAPDLLAWESALDAGQALKPGSVRLMRTPTQPRDGPRLDYGLGTRLGMLEGHPTLGHTGGGQGFSTALLSLPADDLTIVVFRNVSGAPGAPVIAARLARRLLGLGAFSPKDLPVPAELVQALAGDWSGDEGPFRLVPDGDGLAAEVAGSKFRSPYQGDATFAAGEEDLVRFIVDGNRSDWAVDEVGGLFAAAFHRMR
jgi:CubicO group peptidase (beta-lactamase class C family)